MPKLACCFKSLNYIAVNYSQSTTGDRFPTKAAAVKKPFLYSNDLISQTLSKDHLNNIKLHLPRGRAMESKYICKISFSRKTVFARVLPSPKASPYWEGHSPGDQFAAQLRQRPAHRHFKGSAMAVGTGHGALLQTQSSWPH